MPKKETAKPKVIKNEDGTHTIKGGFKLSRDIELIKDMVFKKR